MKERFVFETEPFELDLELDVLSEFEDGLWSGREFQ